jgi:hypothetical protein
MNKQNLHLPECLVIERRRSFCPFSIWLQWHIERLYFIMPIRLTKGDMKQQNRAARIKYLKWLENDPSANDKRSESFSSDSIVWIIYTAFLPILKMTMCSSLLQSLPLLSFREATISTFKSIRDISPQMHPDTIRLHAQSLVNYAELYHLIHLWLN